MSRYWKIVLWTGGTGVTLIGIEYSLDPPTLLTLAVGLLLTGLAVVLVALRLIIDFDATA